MANSFDRLKEERLRLGLNQTEFGEIGGVKKDAQLKYEAGTRYPDGRYYEAIAAAGADVQYILTGIRSNRAAEQNPGYGVLNKREEALLDNYRHIADEEGKRYVERSAQMAAKAEKDEKEPGKKNRA